eukprot:5786793-Amphidinium_carterae.1
MQELVYSHTATDQPLPPDDETDHRKGGFFRRLFLHFGRLVPHQQWSRETRSDVRGTVVVFKFQLVVLSRLAIGVRAGVCRAS